MRCSALGALFSVPKDAKEKAAGNLSLTAKKYLIKMYGQLRWGRYKDISTKQMLKGILGEPELIKLLSIVDGILYEKNEERKSNKYITGVCDIVQPSIIIDGKASWDHDTFLPQIISPIDDGYDKQLQGYMWLWDKPMGKLSYGLITAPECIIADERYYLLKRMDVISEESNEYKVAETELLKNLVYDDIPPQERVVSFEIARDESFIAQIPGKVIKARKFLQEFQELHLSKNTKTIKQLVA
jgi:hypothetical protein